MWIAFLLLKLAVVVTTTRCWSATAFSITTKAAWSIRPSPQSTPRPSFALRMVPSNVTATLLSSYDEVAIDDDSYTDLVNQLENYSTQMSAASFPLNFQLESSEVQDEEGSVPQEGLSDIWKARLLLCGAAALYGTNFSLVKLLGDTMPVGVSTTLRFGMAALALLPWLVSNPKKDSLTAAWLGFEVGMWNAIGYVAQAVGLGTTPASESAFICSLAVVTVPLLDFFTGKQLQPRQWVGVLMAVVGVAFLELGGSMSIDSISSGDLLSMIQPLAFGMGFWRMERAMHHHPDEAARVTAGQLMAVFVASAAYCGFSIDHSTLASYPWAEWLSSPSLLFSIFWTGCITTALTVYMETLALKTLSAAETTLIFSTEPLWGTAFAAAVMGEQLGMDAGIGAALILSACIYSNLGWRGILSFIPGYKGKQVAASPQQPITKRTFKDLPHNLQKQWMWFGSSAAATAATWSMTVQSKVPMLEKFEGVFEEITEMSDKFQ